MSFIIEYLKMTKKISKKKLDKMVDEVNEKIDNLSESDKTILTRKYKWATATELLKNITKKYLPKFFIGNDKESDIENCEMLLDETDEFHPWDTDGDLQTALDNDKNNYDQIDDAVVACFEDIYGKIYDWYSDAMNHAPGYRVPKMIKLNDTWWETLECEQKDLEEFMKKVYSRT